MKIPSSLFAAFAFVCCTIPSYADPAAPPAPVQAAAKDQAVAEITIPFEITATGHQLVVLDYNGQHLRMILDTGSGGNILTPDAAKKLNLEAKPSANLAAGLGTTNSKISTLGTVEFTHDSKKVPIENVMELDLGHVQAAGGQEGVDGLLGSPFCQAYRVTIDFATKKITLRPQALAGEAKAGN